MLHAVLVKTGPDFHAVVVQIQNLKDAPQILDAMPQIAQAHRLAGDITACVLTVTGVVADRDDQDT